MQMVLFVVEKAVPLCQRPWVALDLDPHDSYLFTIKAS